MADDSSASDSSRHRQLAVKIAERLDNADRKAVIAWAEKLLGDS